MGLTISRSGDRYLATLTPPHGGSVAWSAPAPMTRVELIDVLRSRGCHTTDIGDAFYEADPDWLDRE